ncbi:MAG: tRNA adenosine(34) deaminase TadA [Firmicutes bacterium]|nr:tRNA adenosine(34) deaminase TadA [Bacillota bacterium]MBR5489240.1 tRNA adenosine(34) deaminase TadA [Bacillota bacterium]
MSEALKEAEKARALGEIPIGAVIVRDGEIIGRGHNLTETEKDPTAHAEMVAIREAAKALGGWRLTGCQMYVTVEPCCMCAGAAVWARIEKLYVGATEPKSGACGSLYNIVQDERLNHCMEVETGLMEDQCRHIMKSFFRERRKEIKRTGNWKQVRLTKEKESEETKE